MTLRFYLRGRDPMVLGLVPSGWESRISTPLLAAQFIGCIGAHGCLVLLSRVGEIAAALNLLGFVYYFLFILGYFYSMPGDDHSFMGGIDDTWSGGLVGM